MIAVMKWWIPAEAIPIADALRRRRLSSSDVNAAVACRLPRMAARNGRGIIKNVNPHPLRCVAVAVSFNSFIHFDARVCVCVSWPYILYICLDDCGCSSTDSSSIGARHNNRFVYIHVQPTNTNK